MIRPINPKVRAKATKETMSKIISEQLSDIYSNKSSEEFKMCGDITKSPTYKVIEEALAELKTLKGFKKQDADELKTTFATLHRPIFKKLVSEYVNEPTTRNTSFTIIFTLGYRVLASEIARIMISTEATDKGIVYQPHKLVCARDKDMYAFIKYMNSSVEAEIDAEVKRNKENGKKESDEEKAIQEAFVGGFIANISNSIRVVDSVVSTIFKIGNPLATISSIINMRIEMKVACFDRACAMYNATKEAYEDYCKQSSGFQKDRVKKNYERLMKKYNMEMKNLGAKIEHYGQRAIDKTEDDINKGSNSKPTKPTKPDEGKPNDTKSDDIDF